MLIQKNLLPFFINLDSNFKIINDLVDPIPKLTIIMYWIYFFTPPNSDLKYSY